MYSNEISEIGGKVACLKNTMKKKWQLIVPTVKTNSALSVGNTAGLVAMPSRFRAWQPGWVIWNENHSSKCSPRAVCLPLALPDSRGDGDARRVET